MLFNGSIRLNIIMKVSLEENRSVFHVKQRVLTSDLLCDFDILVNPGYIGMVLNYADEFFNNIG